MNSLGSKFNLVMKFGFNDYHPLGNKLPENSLHEIPLYSCPGRKCPDTEIWPIDIN